MTAVEHYPKGVLHSLGQFKNFHFTQHAWNAHCTVTTNHLLHSSPLVCPDHYLTIGPVNWGSLTFSLNTCRQKEHSGWWHIPAQDCGPVRRQWQWWHSYNRQWCGWNIVEEVHAIKLVPNSASYNMEKLNLDILQVEQQQDKFCINKVKAMRTNQDHSFTLDNNNILWEMLRLRYTIQPTTVVPRKLTSLIIVEVHNGKGHQGISCTMNMVRCYFWWIGMHRDIHQHIGNCQLYIQFLPNQLYAQAMHLEIPKVPFTGCAMDCIGPLPATSKGNRHTLTLYAC